MDDKISIRPIIESIIFNNKSTEVESFQNLSLRPIIKLQHAILIAFFKKHLISRKTSFKNLSAEKSFLFIENSLTKDNRLKNRLIGMIIGLFTLDEFEVYLENSSEYNKRILNILKTRYKDSLSQLQ